MYVSQGAGAVTLSPPHATAASTTQRNRSFIGVLLTPLRDVSARRIFATPLLDASFYLPAPPAAISRCKTLCLRLYPKEIPNPSTSHTNSRVHAPAGRKGL